MPTTPKKLMGRPPKFQEARRPITVTLPERTLNKLAMIDPDKALAIVKAADAMIADDQDIANAPLVETIEVAPNQGLIVVGPSEELRKIPWLRLVQITPARYLLSIPTGRPIESLELEIFDLLENLPSESCYEKTLLNAVREKIRSIRKQSKISKAEILFVDID